MAAEWLDIDGFSLDTPAWFCADLSGLLDRPDMRTSTRLIPGAAGVIVYPAKATVSRRTVPMLISGAVDEYGAAYADPRVGVQVNVEKINRAIVDPVVGGDGTRLATLHLASGNRTSRVRVLAPLGLSEVAADGYLAVLDLEFPYGMFPTTLPGAPTGVFASGGVEQATVVWQPPASDGGMFIKNYIVSAYRVGSAVAVASASPTNTLHNFTGLPGGYDYIFRVRAVTLLGQGPWSAYSAPVSVTSAPATTGAFALGFPAGFDN